MLVLLLIGIFILLLIAYYSNSENLLSPAVIICTMFALATVTAIIGNLTWNYKIHFITCIVIWSVLLVFVLFSSFSTFLFSKSYVDEYYEDFSIPTKAFVILLFLVSVVLTALNIRHFQSIAGSSGWGGLLQFGVNLKRVRDLQTLGRVTSSGISGLTNYYTRAVSYIGIFMYLYSIVVCKKSPKDFLYLLLPSIPYFIDVLLSTGRSSLTGLVVYVVNIYGILLLTSRDINPDAKRKFIKWLIVIATIFVLVFFTYGMLRQGSIGKGGFLNLLSRSFSIYVGFSIPSFDYFLTHPWPKSTVFGASTLMEWYSFLSSLGFDVPQGTSWALAPITINGATGNLYTGLRRYLQDYSYLGMYLLMALQGFLSSFSFNYLIKKKNHPIMLIMYSIWIYPIFEMMEEERFVTSLGMTPILTLISICIMYYFMAGINIKLFDFNTIRTIE